MFNDITKDEWIAMNEVSQEEQDYYNEMANYLEEQREREMDVESTAASFVQFYVISCDGLLVVHHFQILNNNPLWADDLPF